jgi:hypothetical protein
MTTINKTTTLARDTHIIAGITKDLTTTPTLLLAGSPYTPVTLTALVQSRIDAANAVASARATWLAAVATYDALYTHVAEVETGLKHYVMNPSARRACSSPTSASHPPKVTTQTVEEKQLAVQKRAATRAARNTMSKKTKAKIKGTVTPPATPAVATRAPTVTPSTNGAPAAPKS